MLKNGDWSNFRFTVSRQTKRLRARKLGLSPFFSILPVSLRRDEAGKCVLQKIRSMMRRPPLADEFFFVEPYDLDGRSSCNEGVRG